MNFQQLISDSISMIDRNQNIPSSVIDFIRTQRINMSEIWIPDTDIFESSDNIKILLNIPGVKSDTVDVDFYNNIVIVTGNREKPLLCNNGDFIKNEIIYGNFERKITLPIAVTNRQSVSISTKDGVLSIIINKIIEESNRFSVRLEDNGSSEE